MIETVNLWFSYRSEDVLRGVNFRAERGEVTVLLGRNGAGKSTLLMHLNGLLRPNRGEVRVDGKAVEYTRKGLIELRRRVGFVFQNPDDQIVAPTVWQEVAFGPQNAGIYDEEVLKRSLKAMGLEGYENRLCNTLSGGEKKRLTIASVLAMEPDYIIMDEPTAGLDGFGLRDMVRTVKNLRKEGKSLIISTHDLDFAMEIADRFVILEKGRVIYEGDQLDFSLAERCGIRLGYLRGDLVVVPHDADIPDSEFDFIAVMGKSARDRLAALGIEADINSASLERAILRALSGSSVMLVCSRSMLGVVLREAGNFPVRLRVVEGGGVEGGAESEQLLADRGS